MGLAIYRSSRVAFSIMFSKTQVAFFCLQHSNGGVYCLVRWSADICLRFTTTTKSAPRTENSTDVKQIVPFCRNMKTARPYQRLYNPGEKISLLYCILIAKGCLLMQTRYLDSFSFCTYKTKQISYSQSTLYQRRRRTGKYLIRGVE